VSGVGEGEDPRTEPELYPAEFGYNKEIVKLQLGPDGRAEPNQEGFPTEFGNANDRYELKLGPYGRAEPNHEGFLTEFGDANYIDELEPGPDGRAEPDAEQEQGESPESEFVTDIISITQSISSMTRTWFGKSISDHQMQDLVDKCIASADLNYGIKEAVTWAGGFKFPEGITNTNWRELQDCDLDLPKLAQNKQLARRSNRFNRERVGGWPDEDPNKQTLLSLVDGMEIFTGPNFTPNGRPPRPRDRYIEVAPAVNRMMFEQYQKGGVLLLPTQKLVENLGNQLHYSSTSWAPKKGKPQGRTITDPSYIPAPMTPLNDKEVKEVVREVWGEIRHPTLQDLAEMVLSAIDKFGADNVILWKHDLSNAFGLLDILPRSVPLLANELTDDVTLVYMVGMFGWVGTPYAFDVITRSLRWAIRRAIPGFVDMYVDDIMAASEMAQADKDMETAVSIAESLLGDGAIAKDKAEKGRRLDFLGWVFDIDSGIVSISERNFLKTFYGFYSADLESGILVRDMERLASWASRYALLSRSMKPFVKILYQSYKLVPNRSAKVHLTEDVTFTIRLWRSFLAAIRIHESTATRTIESFRNLKPEWIVQFDASLTGIGIVFKRVDESEWQEGFGLSVPFTFGSDSSFQNTMEFLAVLLSIVQLARLGQARTSVILIGDSRVALRWAEQGSIKGRNARRAIMAFALLCSDFDIRIERTEHVLGKDNQLCDDLSRLEPASVLRQHNITPSFTDIPAIISDVLELCNPWLPLESEFQFQSFQNEISIIARRLRCL
jgi:hypothetical protein